MNESLFKIKTIKAREILDCRGDPTIEVDVITEGGIIGRADAPTGRSRGRYEAFELRDYEKRYGGLGVQKAVRIVNELIASLLKGMDVRNQREIDYSMIEYDGTENKSRLGGNSIVAVSLAVAKAASASLSMPLYRYIGGTNSYILPVPMFLYICGGKLAATDLDFQEFSVMPIGAKTFTEALRMGSEVYHTLGKILSRKYGKYSINTGDEGSFSPPGLNDPSEVFEVILEAIEEEGYEGEFILALDAAATHMYNEETGKYRYRGREISREQLIDVYEDLVKTYPLKSIEDPLHEDDFEGFAELTSKLNIQIVGDDLFASNIKRLIKGVEIHAANTVLLKVNQVGTLTEALETVSYANRNGY
ncbi:MAG: phosphopyruvate hydratase, partial [Candidatus Methanomethylicia archaeon]